MSGYTVEVRTGILTGDHDLHTWLHITKPDGTAEAWGLHPATDSLKTEHSSSLPGGNEIADLGSFARTDGTTSIMADVNLAADTFHRSFTDVIPTTPKTAALPDMQGSGVVRDLRQAASITTAGQYSGRYAQSVCCCHHPQRTARTTRCAAH